MRTGTVVQVLSECVSWGLLSVWGARARALDLDARLEEKLEKCVMLICVCERENEDKITRLNDCRKS